MEFTEKELDLIRVLTRSGYHDPDKYFSYPELYNKLELKSKGVNILNHMRGRIRSLEKKLGKIGVSIDSTESIQTGRMGFGIDPIYNPKLKEHIPKPEKKETLLMWLGSLGWGTIFVDHRALVGLNYFLYNNKYQGKPLIDALDGSMFVGGAIPFVPEFYTKRASDYMRVLGKNLGDIEDMGERKRKLKELKDSDIHPSVIEFYQKHAYKKILTKSEAASTAKVCIETILGDDYKQPVHLFAGNEDVENMIQLHEMKITDLQERSRFVQRTEEKIEKLTNNLSEYEIKSELIRKKVDLLNTIIQMMDEYISYDDPAKMDFNMFINGSVLKGQKEKFQELGAGGSELRNFFRQIRDSVKTTEKGLGKLEKVIKKAETERKKIEDKAQVTDRDLKSYNDKILAAKRQAEASQFFKFTRRIQISPDEEVMVWHMVSKEYYDTYLAPIGEKYDFRVHSEARKDITINGFSVRIEYNPNIFSYAPRKNVIRLLRKRLALDNERDRQLSNLNVSAHSKEPLKVKFDLLERENTILGEYRQEPDELEITMTLPTFYSARKLEYGLRNRLTRVDHLKRYADSPQEQGVVFEMLSPEGKPRTFGLSTKNLSRIGLYVKKMDLYTKRLSNKNLGKTRRKFLKNEIARYKKMLELDDLYTIIAAGDTHLGSFTFPGRPSSSDGAKAIMSHILQDNKEDLNQTPHWFFLSEWLHGSIRSFASDRVNYQLLSYQVDTAIERIKTDNTIDNEKRIELLAELTSMQTGLGTVPSVSQQKVNFKRLVEPFIKEILQSNSNLVVYPSGNHYGRTTFGLLDEAIDFKSLMPTEVSEQIIPIAAPGEDYGSGHVRMPNNMIIYTAHKTKARKDDELGPTIDQVNAMRSPAKGVVAFDTHRPNFAKSGKRWYVMPPGNQSTSPFVDQIGISPSAKGYMKFKGSNNEFYDDFYDITLVSEKTLLEYVPEFKRKTELQKELVEKYIPWN